MTLTFMSDAQVIERCREEREIAPRHIKQEEAACLELLRRAIALWIPEAFEAVNNFYSREFVGWVISHQRYEEFCSLVPYLTPEDIVQNAYIKLHRTLQKRDDFHGMFSSMSYFMSYCRGTISNCLNDYLPRRPKMIHSGSPLAHSIKNNALPPVLMQKQFSPAHEDDPDSLIPDPKSLPEVVESTLNWSIALEYANTLLTEDEREVLGYKILNTPIEELLQSGKTLDEINKVWKHVVAVLYRDSRFRHMFKSF